MAAKGHHGQMGACFASRSCCPLTCWATPWAPSPVWALVCVTFSWSLPKAWVEVYGTLEQA